MTEPSQNVPNDLQNKPHKSAWQAGTPAGPVVTITTGRKPPKTRNHTCGNTDGCHLSDVHVRGLSPVPDELTNRQKII